MVKKKRTRKGVLTRPKDEKTSKELENLVRQYYKERGIKIRKIKVVCDKCGWKIILAVPETIKNSPFICNKCGYEKMIEFD